MWAYKKAKMYTNENKRNAGRAWEFGHAKPLVVAISNISYRCGAHHDILLLVW